MVRSFFCFVCLWGISWLGVVEAVTPVIETSIDSTSAQVKQTLKGTVSVTHDKKEKVDRHSFTLNGKPLEVSLVRVVPMSSSSDTLVSLYSFQLPGQDKGLYVLPSIRVKVGNQIYSSLPTAYAVDSKTPSSTLSTRNSSADDAAPVVFRLEALVKGPTTLYPGERTQLFYRISYNRSIDLTQSELPFVHPAHFEKIGDAHIKDYQTTDLTIQEITQEVAASEIGTFQFPPAHIQGYAYTLDASNQKIYNPTLLQANAPAMTLEVKPFPTTHQPGSFTGALGNVQMSAKLLTPPSVAIGDPLELQMKVQGVENLEEMRLSPLECQPGFSGFFQTSDLPPPAEVEENTKIFQVELRPLSTFITHIPSIEVSSFDPKTETYVIQQSDPIALNIYTNEKTKSSLPPLQPAPPPLPKLNKWPKPTLSPAQLQGHPAQLHDLKTPWIRTPWVLWIIPIGVGLWSLQKWGHRHWQKRPKPNKRKSEEFLQRALKPHADSLESVHLLEQALWWRLWEKGILKQGVAQADKLPEEEGLKSVRELLLKLQTLQYSPHQTFDLPNLQQQAGHVIREI